MAPSRIVVPTDFSPLADAALDVAIDLAKLAGARIAIVHVSAPVMVLPPPFELVPVPTLFPDDPRRIQEGLEARGVRVAEAGLAFDVADLTGTVPTEILRYATEHHADLVIMGTHGHGSVGHAMLGSVAERVLHGARCPVMVVPGRR
jgi:nucleotide-binding universal stress UspA family protein